jgi:hypothetical protein
MGTLTNMHSMLLLFIRYCIELNFRLWVLQDDN